MSSKTKGKETTESACCALDFTGWLIDSLGQRPAGSDASRAAADAFKEEAVQFAGRTWTEDFPVHPGAFLGWIRLMVIFYALSVVCLWIGLYLVAALLTSLGLAIMIGQFFLYHEVIDPFFPRRTGRNVLASIEPEQEARAQLIVSGHHDSAHVFNFLVHQPSLYPLRVYGGLGSSALLIIASWILTLWTAIAGEAPAWSAVAAGVLTLLLLIVVLSSGGIAVKVKKFAKEAS